MSVEDWAEIRRLHRAEGLPIKMIARTLGISRNTVRAALASEGPPKYERKAAGSAVDGFEDAIRVQLAEVPTMPATVIAERVGWTRGMTVFNERARELRPAYLPPDPAGRTTYDAGNIAQCDLWFPPVTVPVGYGQTRSPMQLPVLTMVLGYSRWLSAILLPSRRAEDLFAGCWQLITALGAVLGGPRLDFYEPLGREHERSHRPPELPSSTVLRAIVDPHQAPVPSTGILDRERSQAVTGT